MEVTNSLIRKFFSNQCNEEEFEAVTKYFELHPELLAKGGLFCLPLFSLRIR